MLAQSNPARSKQLMESAQHDANARWQLYEQLASVHRVVSEDGHANIAAAAAPAAPAAAGDNKPAATPAQESTS
jgi:pyruvate-ferredoxin/flavodoxin oxidoreductase